MPILSFSIPEHIELLLDGRKVQTTRRPRKNPLKVGDLLYCYYKPRQKGSCRNCITPCQYNYERRQHFGYSSMPTALKSCNIWNNYFGEAEIIDIQHHYRTWPDNHRDLVKGGYYVLFGDMPETTMMRWAEADGFANLQEAHKYFTKSTKSNQWMFWDWDVIIFEPSWVKK